MLIQKLKIILKSNIILIFLIIVVFINEIYSINNTNKNITNTFMGIITSIKIKEDNYVLTIKNKYNVDGSAV